MASSVSVTAAHNDYAGTDNTKMAGVVKELFRIQSGRDRCLRACFVFSNGVSSFSRRETRAVCENH